MSRLNDYKIQLQSGELLTPPHNHYFLWLDNLGQNYGLISYSNLVKKLASNELGGFHIIKGMSHKDSVEFYPIKDVKSVVFSQEGSIGQDDCEHEYIPDETCPVCIAWINSGKK